MYIPSSNREADPTTLLAYMRENSFATVVSTGAHGLVATHLPVLTTVREDVTYLEFHLAKANAQHRTIEGQEVLVIFTGPDAYIRPSWYPSKQSDGETVPTWNYAAVHAYGQAHVRADVAFLRAHVTALTATHEGSQSDAWTIEDAPAAYISAALKAIVGIEVRVSRIEGKWKMGQNLPVSDVMGAASGLMRRATGHDREVAQLMRERKGRSK